MATFLDSNLLGLITPVFIFFFIFVLFFALMEKLKFFGGKAGVHALIAFCLAFLFIIVPEARQIINFVTPWFVVLVIFSLLIIVGLMFLGYKEEDLIKGITEGGTITGLAIVFVVVLFFIAISQVFGASALQPGGTGIIGSLKSTIFNAKVLGVCFIMIVAAEVVRTLGRTQ